MTLQCVYAGGVPTVRSYLVSSNQKQLKVTVRIAWGVFGKIILAYYLYYLYSMYCICIVYSVTFAKTLNNFLLANFNRNQFDCEFKFQLKYSFLTAKSFTRQNWLYNFIFLSDKYSVYCSLLVCDFKHIHLDDQTAIHFITTCFNSAIWTH